MVMDTNHIDNGPRVFLFPYFAYGHVSPFLELAKKLIEGGFYVYLCNTSVNLKPVEKKIGKNPCLNLKLQLVELDLPELLPQHQTTNGLPIHLIPTLEDAIVMSKPRVSNILKALNPDMVIHDHRLQWMESLASDHNIPVVRFLPLSAVCSYLYDFSTTPGMEFPLPLDGFPLDQPNFHRLIECMSGERVAKHEIPYNKIMLIKTSREMEGNYIHYISDVTKFKVIPVGLLVQEPDCDDRGANIELMEWLGKKNEYSTVFVSFGTEVFLKKEEIEEMALGLELSGLNFIWVIRLPEDKKATLPEGFLERIGEKGRVVQGWAPQADILSHPSTGGFVSHCGWNSTVESLQFGIPLIAMPMQYDQPLNARLAVEIGIGVEVMKDENDNYFQRKQIAKVIKDVVVGDMAQGMRKHIKDMRDKVKMREKEEMDQVYQLLARICDDKTASNGGDV